MNEKIIEAAAQLSHEANRIYCKAIGDDSQRPWEEAPSWQKDSARQGIMKVIEGATPEQLHENWMQVKLEAGWKHGTVKDEVQKTHPCMVPYAELPPEQRAKDDLYRSVVQAMLTALKDR